MQPCVHNFFILAFLPFWLPILVTGKHIGILAALFEL